MALYDREPNDDQLGSEAGAPTGTPRWVKVFGGIALIVIVVFLLVLLVRGGEHGPSRHSPGDGPSRHSPGNGGDRPAGPTGPPEGVTHP